MSDELFHYKSCGLPKVCLRNGYTVKETKYGEAVSIHNLEGLHRVIGLGLVHNNRTLTSDEVRFLRKEMDLPQAQLATLLDVSESTVRNWESGGEGRADIPGPADRVLRKIYLEYINENSSLREILERLAQLNRDRHELECLEFAETDGEWLVAA